MKRSDLKEYEAEEIREDISDKGTYVEYDKTHDFIDEIEGRLNGIVKDLDSIDCIADLYKIEEIRDEIKALADELY